MKCAKCGATSGCDCWVPCACGGTREAGFACSNQACSRSVPTLTADEWEFLLDVAEPGDVGYALEMPRAKALRRLRAERMIVTQAPCRVVTTEHGRECVAEVARLWEQGKRQAVRDTRNKARRERPKKAGKDV